MDFNFNLYVILGVTNNVSDDEIKKIYRKLSLKYHPDNPDTGDEELFKKISVAYSILKNPEKRKLYDLGQWDDLEPENEINLSEAEQNIVALFSKDLDSTDLFREASIDLLDSVVKEIERDLEKSIADYNHDLVDLACEVDFLKNLKDKVKFKGRKTKYNLMEMAIKQNISLKEEEIKDIKSQIFLAKETLNILSDFKNSKIFSGLFTMRNKSFVEGLASNHRATPKITFNSEK